MLFKRALLLWLLVLVLAQNVSSKSAKKNEILSADNKNKLDAMLLMRSGDLCDRDTEEAFFEEVTKVNNLTVFEAMISKPEYNSGAKMCNRFAGLECDHIWENPSLVYRCMCQILYIWNPSTFKCALRKYGRCTWNRDSDPDGEKGSLQLSQPSKYSALKDYNFWLECMDNTYCHTVTKNCVCYDRATCPKTVDTVQMGKMREQMKLYRSQGLDDKRFATYSHRCHNYLADFYRKGFPAEKIIDYDLIQQFFESPKDDTKIYCDILNFMDCDWDDKIIQDKEYFYEYDEYYETMESYVAERERPQFCNCINGFERVGDECHAPYLESCSSFFWHGNVWYDFTKTCFVDETVPRLQQLACVTLSDIRGTDEEVNNGICCPDKGGEAGWCTRDKYSKSRKTRLGMPFYMLRSGIVREPSNVSTPLPIG